MKFPEKQVQVIDRPDLPEVFCDAVGLSTFDGNSIRVELCVTRLNPPKPPEPPTARRYVAARLVITPEASVDLWNQLSGMVRVMEEKGMVRREAPRSAPPAPPTSPATH